MAQTIQSVSHTLVETAKRQHTTSSSSFAHSEEPETKDNLNTLISLFDDMLTVSATLHILDLELNNYLKELKTKQVK